jgi:transposase
MTTTAPHQEQSHPSEATLFLAFALSAQPWQLGFTTGQGQKPRERTMTARQPERVLDAIAQAQRRLGLPDTAPVVRGEEAGRAACWLHRFWLAHGLTHPVGDASSMEVHRRRRRATSDGVDVRKWLRMLRRYHQGARHGWPGVKGPAVEAAEHRHLPRALASLKQERASPMTRLEGRLRRQGLRVPRRTTGPAPRDALRLWAGSPMRPGLRRRGRRV